MHLDTASLELLAIVVLILANGFFSAAEISIVVVRKSRLAQLISDGRAVASVVVALKDDPTRFLATVQVGVTVVSSMASVIGGAATVRYLEPLVHALLPEMLSQWAEFVALSITVVLISYFMLVVGELVPKSLALAHSERLACLAARPINRVSLLAHPLVKALTLSTDAVLWLFGQHAKAEEAFVSEEEVKHMVREGARHGIFDEAERQLIHSVFEFTDTSVREVMVPRSEVHAVEAGVPPADILKELVETGFSRLPVFQGDLDHIVGIVHIKDLLREVQRPQPVPLPAVMHPAFFVPDSMQISDLLRELQSRRTHMAIVVNEFGTVIGLVTIEDLLEEIVGEIRDEFDFDEEQAIQELPDGSLLVQGSVPLAELKEQYSIPFEETADYRTLAGLVLARLKRFPKGGEAITEAGYKMTVVVLDGRRLRKIRIEGPIKRRTTHPQTTG
ncbi:MAG TPA: hemolysin family protein [Candidatus Margulisiibacteriota bacterium]|nr:hemolysin family protein [Candidatus Margulisiibacteriota bacterium]